MALMSAPSMRIVPALGNSKPASIRSSVVLPDPEPHVGGVGIGRGWHDIHLRDCALHLPLLKRVHMRVSRRWYAGGRARSGLSRARTSGGGYTPGSLRTPGSSGWMSAVTAFAYLMRLEFLAAISGRSR